MCVYWLGGLNLLLALCSKQYSIQIYQIFSIASLVLGEVIAQFWLLCSDWLCLCWSHCCDPHTHFFQKCLYLIYYWFQRFAMYSQCLENQETIYCKSFGVVRFTLDWPFKVKQGQVRIKVLITCLLLVIEVCNVSQRL